MKREHEIVFNKQKSWDIFSSKLLLAILFSISFIYNAPAEAGGSDLQQLTNEELLSLAEKIYTVSHDNFRIELRRLYYYESQSEKRKNALEAFLVPSAELIIPSEELTSVALSAVRLEHRNQLLKAQQQKLEFLESVRDGLDELIYQIDNTQSEGLHFSEGLDSLNIYLVEINLRLSDLTLEASKVPPIISQQTVISERRKLSGILNQLRKEAETAENKFINIVKDINEIKIAITESEVFLFSAKNKHLQEQSNLELESRYRSMPAEKLVMLYAGLWEEKKWLRNSYDSAHKRFLAIQAKADTTLSELKLHGPIDVKDIVPSGFEAAETAIEILDSMLTYNSKRVAKLVEWQSELKELMTHAETFEVEAKISGEHISKMKYIAEIINNIKAEKRVNLESLLPKGWYSEIIKDDQLFVQQASNARAADHATKNQIILNEKELGELISSENEIRIRISNLKRNFESAENTKRWNAEFDALTQEQLIEKFVVLTESLNEKQEPLKSEHNSYMRADEIVKNIKRNIDALKNPFFLITEDESIEERYKIVTRLYNFAEVKPPKRIKQKSFVSANISTRVSLIDNSNNKDSENPYQHKGLEEYQNLLSQKVREIEKKKQYSGDYKLALDSLNIYLDNFIEKRNEIADIMQQRYLCSIKIIQLFGHGEIESSDIPEGISDALNEEEIQRFESLTTGLIDVKLNVLQQLESINPAKEEDKQYELLAKIKDNLSSRVEFHQQLQALQQEFENKEELSGIALKIAEQLAVSRQNSENTFKDILFDFIKTAETDNYSEILRSSYVEVLEIEKKQNILNAQTKKIEHLIKLEYSENSFIPDLLTFLNNNLEQLEAESEEEWVKIEARLMPQKADEILNTFEMKTGRRIFTPPPIPESGRHAVINSAADILFDYFLQIATVKRWINLYRFRMTPSGIENEIDHYNSLIGEIEARNSVLDSKLKEYIGHPIEDLGKMDSEDQPKTQLEKLKFLKGKIGALRDTRNQWRLKSAKFIVIKITFILFFAFLLIWAINRVGRKVDKQNKNKNNDFEPIEKQSSWIMSKLSDLATKLKFGNTEDGDAFAYFKSQEFQPVLSFIKHLVKIIIWIVAIALLLETIGFKVGAILAGLGIGGFAVAFALKDILIDFFGGMTIMATEPFKVGDSILFNGESAKVTEVGIRYSKLNRSSDNNLITVPNHMLTAKELVNLSHSSTEIISSSLKLSTKNNYDKIKLALIVIENILKTQSESVKFKWVRHDSFDENSFVLKVKYEIFDSDNSNNIRTFINTEIIKQFHENHIEFS